jgi:hypothetical protein
MQPCATRVWGLELLEYEALSCYGMKPWATRAWGKEWNNSWQTIPARLIFQLIPLCKPGLNKSGSPSKKCRYELSCRYKLPSCERFYLIHWREGLSTYLCKSLLDGTPELIMWTKWGSPSIPFGRGELHTTHWVSLALSFVTKIPFCRWYCISDVYNC